MNSIFRASASKLATPAAVLALGLSVSACDINYTFGEDGVPLSELDMSGSAPTELVMAGPDTVEITQGEALAITVDGSTEAKEQIRFRLEDGSLAIMREGSNWNDSDKATIRVTMPAPTDLTLAGSGTINAAAMASNSSVTVAGSGVINLPKLDADQFALTIAGSGQISAEGEADALEMTIAGSGQANMANLTVANAEVTVVGSGNAEFASNGTVEGSFVGSGNVTVTGNATCDMSGVGSGQLICSRSPTAPAADAAAEPTEPAQITDQSNAVPPPVPTPEAPEPAPAPASGDVANLRAEAELKRAEAEAARAEADAARAEAALRAAEARAGAPSTE